MENENKTDELAPTAMELFGTITNGFTKLDGYEKAKFAGMLGIGAAGLGYAGHTAYQNRSGIAGWLSNVGRAITGKQEQPAPMAEPDAYGNPQWNQGGQNGEYHQPLNGQPIQPNHAGHGNNQPAAKQATQVDATLQQLGERQEKQDAYLLAIHEQLRNLAVSLEENPRYSQVAA